MTAFLFVLVFFPAVSVEAAFGSGSEPKEGGTVTGDGESNSGGIPGRLGDGEEPRVAPVPLGLFRLAIDPGEGITGRGCSKPFTGGLGSTEPGRGTVGKGEELTPRGSFPTLFNGGRGGDNWGKGYIGDGNGSSKNGVFGSSRGGVGKAERGVSVGDEGGWFVEGTGSLISTTATPTTPTVSAMNLTSWGILAQNDFMVKPQDDHDGADGCF
jgi:hypothetical protein